MSKSKTRGKSRALQKFIMIIIILIIVILIGFFCIYRPLKQRFVSAVTQELISSQLSSGELSDDDVAAIMDSMSAEDRAILEATFLWAQSPMCYLTSETETWQDCVNTLKIPLPKMNWHRSEPSTKNIRM